MIAKKLFSITAAILLVCGFNTNAFAEFFSFGIGIPIQHSFSSKWDGYDTVEAEGVTGTMVQVKFPVMLGIGYESYVTDIKSYDKSLIDDITLTTTMLDLFWMTPIPVVNFTIGVGLGMAALDCELASGESCKDNYEEASLGSAYQWFAQLGYNFLPFLDAHVSYHDVTAKVKEKDSGDTNAFKSTVIGLGVALIF